ncbi:hypothetical protein SPHINGOR109_10952 [Sphingorhabdus sp. 109]|nr:hypothetical protein SPHINGOR109_10952 [Sphingorhabdus sp. 109]
MLNKAILKNAIMTIIPKVRPHPIA